MALRIGFRIGSGISVNHQITAQAVYGSSRDFGYALGKDDAGQLIAAFEARGNRGYPIRNNQFRLPGRADDQLRAIRAVQHAVQ